MNVPAIKFECIAEATAEKLKEVCFPDFGSLYLFVHSHEEMLLKNGRALIFLLKTTKGVDVIHIFRENLTLIWKGEEYTGSNTVLAKNNFHIIPPQRI